MKMAIVAAVLAVSISAMGSYAQDRGAEKVHRIGFLWAGPPPKMWVEAFQQGLREHGYVDGQNVIVEFAVTEGNLDQLPEPAEKLVRSDVDVILASSSPAAVAASKATTSVPIVFVNVFDPLGIGLIASLAHPGANVTGMAFTSAEQAGKRLNYLRDLIPKLDRVAVLSHPATPSNAKQLEGAEVAARALGIALQPIPIRQQSDFDPAFDAARGADALLVLDIAFFTTHRARLTALAAQSRLPAIYGLREMVEAGGLMSYGVSVPDLYRRAAAHVDKIFKGAKPAEIPVELPTKFELVINLQAGQALGLTFPTTLLMLADEVIE
jgi:putative ABC transport system substrate-binding protein